MPSGTENLSSGALAATVLARPVRENTLAYGSSASALPHTSTTEAFPLLMLFPHAVKATERTSAENIGLSMAIVAPFAGSNLRPPGCVPDFVSLVVVVPKSHPLVFAGLAGLKSTMNVEAETVGDAAQTRIAKSVQERPCGFPMRQSFRDVRR